MIVISSLSHTSLSLSLSPSLPPSLTLTLSPSLLPPLSLPPSLSLSSPSLTLTLSPSPSLSLPLSPLPSLSLPLSPLLSLPLLFLSSSSSVPPSLSPLLFLSLFYHCPYLPLSLRRCWKISFVTVIGNQLVRLLNKLLHESHIFCG